MIDFEKEYENACSTPSDINEHLPVISQLVSECKHVTEMGIRSTAVSTRAFLRHNVTYIGYDITEQGLTPFFEEVKASGRDATFIVADVLTINIAETDLLFIDTLHRYGQLKQELRLHADKARKYIVFHDTTLFEYQDEGGGEGGLWPAIQEFLSEHPEWELKERYTNNNGLTVLRRIN